MHEMSLTESLVEMIASEGEKQGFSRVRTVRVAIGALGHVDPEAIRFCFGAVARGTLVEGAELAIDIVPAAAWCFDCAKTVRIAERGAACPTCGRHILQVTGGDELRLEELEVD
jgi:hydrogenase nickel incorporation protein HypA/HybF